jgi:hypothetical protein
MKKIIKKYEERVITYKKYKTITKHHLLIIKYCLINII